MTVTQAFRYALDPTVRQQSLLARAAGTARYAFHGGLALCKRLLDAGKPVPHAAELHRLWNAEKLRRSWVFRARHDPQSAPGAVHRGCWMVGVPADVGVQDPVVRVCSDRRTTFLSVHQDVLGLRPRQGRAAAWAAGLLVRGMRGRDRPRPERGAQPRVARRREFPRRKTPVEQKALVGRTARRNRLP